MIDVSNLIKTPILLHGKPIDGIGIYTDEEGNLVCKNCTKCGLILDKSKFARHGKGPNKVYSMCKNCRNLRRMNRNQGESELKNKRRHIKFWNDSGIPIKCYICSGPFEEIEHVWGKSIGGPTTMINTLPTCVQCNRGVFGKQDRPLCEWLRTERPEYLDLVITKVLSYGVDPFTPCEKITIYSEDIVTGRWIFRNTAGNSRYVDITDSIMEESYRTQRERFT